MGTQAGKSQLDIDGVSGLWLAIWKDGRRGYLVTETSKRPACLAFFDGISKEALASAIIARETEPEFLEDRERLAPAAAWLDFVGAILYPLDCEGLRTEQRVCCFTWDGCFMIDAGRSTAEIYDRADMATDLAARGIALHRPEEYLAKKYGWKKPTKARNKIKAKRLSKGAAWVRTFGGRGGSGMKIATKNSGLLRQCLDRHPRGERLALLLARQLMRTDALVEERALRPSELRAVENRLWPAEASEAGANETKD